MAEFLYSKTYLEDLAGAEPPPVHARFTDMIGYLRSIAPEGRLPGPHDVDPCAFPKLLELINLVEVERTSGTLRFRYRLVGERQNRAAGRLIKGLLVEEAVVPQLVARITGNMRAAVECRLPIYDRFPMPHPNRQFIDSQRMYYPLASDGETVDVLLIVNGYDPLPPVSTGACRRQNA